MTRLSNLIATVVSSLSKVRIDSSVNKRLFFSDKPVVSLLNQRHAHHRHALPLDRSLKRLQASLVSKLST